MLSYFKYVYFKKKNSTSFQQVSRHRYFNYVTPKCFNQYNKSRFPYLCVQYYNHACMFRAEIQLFNLSLFTVSYYLSYLFKVDF